MKRSWLLLLAALVIPACTSRSSQAPTPPSSPAATPASTSSNPKPNSQVSPFPA